MDEKQNLEKLFENLKSGDVLFTYHNKWYFLFSKIIKLFTGGAVDHAMGIMRDSPDIIRITEQTATRGGLFNEYTKDQFINRFNGADINLWHGTIRKNTLWLNEIKAREDADSQVGVKYGWSLLIKTLPFYDYLAKVLRFKKIRTKENLCSTHIAKWLVSGFGDALKMDDNYASPVELMDFLKSFFDIKKIK